MADSTSPTQPFGWRISKACQECRKRKIKCDGSNPCKTCHLRNTPCVYRDIIRQRKKKHQIRHADDVTARPDDSERPSSPRLSQPPGRRDQDVSYTFPNSVSATHMASPSCEVQLYYGATSHFSMINRLYRDLYSHPTTHPEEPQGEVEEAGAGLDLLSFRRIFFGIPSEVPDSSKGSLAAGSPVMFLSYNVAKICLERFLLTLYHLVPFRSKESFELELERMYSPSPDTGSDTSSTSMLLMAVAMGALGTEHYGWGDLLFERVKTTWAALDDVVNLQTIQLSLFMSEQGRPNSSFLYLGTGTRKAISAGLHKDAPNDSSGASKGIEERRTTFWCLYFYESWICFHLGRPSSLSLRDIGISCPEDPFLLVLVHLSRIITRSADEIYGQRHESLLQMWRIARSIVDDLRSFESEMQRALGFGLDKCAQPGELGVCQTILILVYYHAILLTFRPFLIFRGRWRRDMKMSAQQSAVGAANRPTEIPMWLNEACNNALNAARRTIHHLCEASSVNGLVRELRYHGFFMGSACFTLLYDLVHDENSSLAHLPWVHIGIRCLTTMRPGDPITSSIAGLQTVLKKINPLYEWIPDDQAKNTHSDHPFTAHAPPSTSDGPNPQESQVPETFNEPVSGFSLPMLPNVQHQGYEDDLQRASANNVGRGEDLLDLTQADMGWDFDFSTMDLEEFFSIYPGMGQNPP